ncbi:GNAT superfamily N-acetyltransferase [Labrenzia sp. EL_159]|nr:GNAT superfamily N-acetyltransferase [Labrenzia sp. EL_142]MBG6159644.1 GNAT superfamily N-acetyltransferase [Labrenzia sp. EL_162]MBG6197959.1 GNAT superfamily N-acetyltransferase [Labrenzia sp. EL_159]
MSYVEISFADEAEKASTSRAIEDRLLQSLAKGNKQANNDDFILKATDENGHLLGGLRASTSYHWLLIKTLWVDDAVRGGGLGSRLVELAELEARRLGCHGAWLDTSNETARKFYQGLGYQDFGVLGNRPDQALPDHRRWFMKKDL